ncbi:unnamed protein product, partial [Ectocarpus sp. 8 AP-2014]
REYSRSPNQLITTTLAHHRYTLSRAKGSHDQGTAREETSRRAPCGDGWTNSPAGTILSVTIRSMRTMMTVRSSHALGSLLGLLYGTTMSAGFTYGGSYGGYGGSGITFTSSIGSCLVSSLASLLLPNNGDGLCDSSNNNSECEYDFGDCCCCTCAGTSCGAFGYSCVDPNGGTCPPSYCEDFDSDDGGITFDSSDPSPTPAPVSPPIDPVTLSPVTPATDAPVSPPIDPVTLSPVTPATDAPVTPPTDPVTPPPVTPATDAPVTPPIDPVTPSPVTPATPGPVTPSPVTPLNTPAVTPSPTTAPTGTPIIISPSTDAPVSAGTPATDAPGSGPTAGGDTTTASPSSAGDGAREITADDDAAGGDDEATDDADAEVTSAAVGKFPGKWHVASGLLVAFGASVVASCTGLTFSVTV